MQVDVSDYVAKIISRWHAYTCNNILSMWKVDNIHIKWCANMAVCHTLIFTQFMIIIICYWLIWNCVNKICFTSTKCLTTTYSHLTPSTEQYESMSVERNTDEDMPYRITYVHLWYSFLANDSIHDSQTHALSLSLSLSHGWFIKGILKTHFKVYLLANMRNIASTWRSARRNCCSQVPVLNIKHAHFYSFLKHTHTHTFLALVFISLAHSISISIYLYLSRPPS